MADQPSSEQIGSAILAARHTQFLHVTTSLATKHDVRKKKDRAEIIIMQAVTIDPRLYLKEKIIDAARAYVRWMYGLASRPTWLPPPLAPTNTQSIPDSRLKQSPTEKAS